jgi:hypothetical protein
LLALTPVRLGPVTSPSAETRLTELVVPAADLEVAAADLVVEVVEVVGVEPQERRGLLSELPLALIICGVALGLVVIGLHHFRWGNLLIAGSLLAGAFFRLVLPTRRAGLLAVRSRFTDIVTMSAMGGSLMLLALITST